MNDHIAQRRIIMANCAGMVPMLAYSNGFMLALLGEVGISREDALQALAIPSVIGALTSIPLAYVGDRIGTRRMGSIGCGLMIAGICLMIFAAWGRMPNLMRVAIAVDSLGTAALSSVWFTVLVSVVSNEQRGRFLGRMRMSWQLVGVVVGLVLAGLMQATHELEIFLAVLVIFVVCQLTRMTFFRMLPQPLALDGGHNGFLKALTSILPTPMYLPFGAYSFLLRLAVGSLPWVFLLLEKDVHGMSSGEFMLLANLLAVGSLAGFWIGGRLVDRHGTRPVFLVAHAGFAGIALFVLLRGAIPLPIFAVFAIATMCWGMIDACAGIAQNTETFALAPSQHRSLAITILITSSTAGTALSAWAGAAAIRAGLFHDGWTLAGMPMSAFDGLLVIACFLVITFVVTLGLVPAIIRPRQDLT